MSELESGTKFQPVLDDPTGNHGTAKRVVILSGKIYYDLVKERQTRKADTDVAFVRLEELAPFPFHALETVLRRYTNGPEFVYLQEEPRNQGAWPHVQERLIEVLKVMGEGTGRVEYKGRKESALPAPGVGKLYKQQQESVIRSAFE